MTGRYSHPPNDVHDGVPLVDHLGDVAERVGYVVPADAKTPAGEPLRAVVETLAYVHDFGKATTYFQDYLLRSKEPRYEQYRYHAPLGSFAAYYALSAQNFEPETCLAGFVAVAKHHGRLPDVAAYVFSRANRRENVSRGNQNSAELQQAAIAKQIQDIDEQAPELAREVFQNATDGKGSWSAFRGSFAELLTEVRESTGSSATAINRETLSERCYGLVLECWGSLVLADKTSAAAAASGADASAATYDAEKPTFERLDEYIGSIERTADSDRHGSRSERLNFLRAKARASVLSNVESFADADGGVATITLPTGMGKTLTGLSAALSVRDRLGGKRVVYALPFTSIIDQVVAEVEEIYQVDTTGRLLTAHHHLSEATIVDERDEDADEADANDDVAGMLAESWRAGMTVTTFVQLLESLAGPANRQSMKLPALRDSVVVLDEPQSLPLDWWKLVPRLVRMLTEQYGATVIAMTATQPQLFDDATELVSTPETYFEATERVQYVLDDSATRYIESREEPKSYPEAASAIVDGTAGGSGTVADEASADGSVLAVCNTIDSAQALTTHVTDALSDAISVGSVYADVLESADRNSTDVEVETVAERVADAEGRPVLHLSTRLRPVDRLRLIETAKLLTERGRSLVVVSTQLVEAGVDISFDRVYRDLAPIDSIVQAAGRCNRSFERDRGHVVVWWLEAPDEQAKTPSEAVYNRGTALLPVATETLDDIGGAEGTIPEATVSKTAVEEYYRRLHDEKNVGKDAYVEYVNDARADELAELSLIEQRRSVEVVVCRTTEERKRVEAVRAAWQNYEFETVRRLVDSLKEASVSVPIYRSDSREAQALSGLARLHEDTETRWVDARDARHDSYFDSTTGLVTESSVDNRIL
ncbi:MULTISPECIES: CRISPR-associated endonuclease Cas3'' [Haloferax]|uniref:Helicase Cas3 n=1 Tax=Haloferax massiliensis TaxID=1476858 RepID=A0A0D6JVW1_9EURY|nr:MULTISPECIES: CRISPR-associated endonuclease Cas3'' [Haloferax]MDS0242309.1 CRISPR-associated endonuclease Cas3'' [Haloferax sp. S2CR25]MDS0445430.1 CRISPR-associated endonuclease Cas3'' [Haloferax sp. S2CR25-2]CQR53167.1 helicase Cas3 [Haloferax massiliensis]